LWCTCKNRIKVAARTEKKRKKNTPAKNRVVRNTATFDKKEVLVAYFKLDFTAFHKNNFAAYTLQDVIFLAGYVG